MTEITNSKLRRFNLIMGCLYLVQGILMLFLATTVIQKIAEFSPKITQKMKVRSFSIDEKDFQKMPLVC